MKVETIGKVMIQDLQEARTRWNKDTEKIFKPEVHFCPACAHKEIKNWLIKEKHGVEFNIVKCMHCGSGFLNPQPTKEYLQTIYSTSGHGLSQPITFDEVMLKESEYPNATVDAKRLVSYARRLIQMNQERYLMALDIGSGFGFFTKEAINEGFKVTAVNPGSWENDVFIKMNGFYPIKLFFEDVDFINDKFDLIILSQVLEHLEDPIRILDKIRTLLYSDGVLAIAVPNVDSILVKLLKEKDNGCLWVPEHLTYFSKKGLFTLLQRSGLEIKYHKYISRIPYGALSNRLNLKNISRHFTNYLVRVSQKLPLKLLDSLGFGFYHNVWAKKI